MTIQQVTDVINQYIKENNNEEITGSILNSVLMILLRYVNDGFININDVIQILADSKSINIIGSINPQTVTTSLPNGVYNTQVSGNYPNAGNIAVKEGYYTLLRKTGDVWSLESEVKMPEQDLTDIENQLEINTDVINQVTKIDYQKDYKQFTLQAGQVDATGGSSTSVNWIKAVIDVTSLIGKTIYIEGFGSSTSITNWTIPRFTIYKTVTQTGSQKLTSKNDDGLSSQFIIIPETSSILVINLAGGTNIGADIPNSIYNTQFKVYERISNDLSALLDVSKIDLEDRIETYQLTDIEQDIEDLKNKSAVNLLDGVGYPQFELGVDGDKYYDKSSKQFYIKNKGFWYRNTLGRTIPFFKPTAFDWNFGYNIFKNDAQKYFIDWRGLFVEKVKPDYDRLTKYYVDNVNGLDTNNGLTPQTAFKTISKATTVGARNIILAKGLWLFNEGLRVITDDNTTTEPFIIRCLNGKAQFVNGYKADTYVWTLNNNVYSASRSNVVNVIDTSNTDENNLFRNLKRVSSITEVQNTVNSWYTDGTLVYIRTFNNRQPDASIVLIFETQNTYIAGQNVPYVYMENIESYADNTAQSLIIRNNTTTQFNTKVYLKSCGGVGNSRGNGLAIDNIKEAILESCYGANVLRDALNYHTSLLPNSYIPMKVLEIDCYGYNMGVDSTTETSSNGSTTHEGITIVRLNTRVFKGRGSVVADVNSGAMSLNLSVESNEDLINDGSGTSFRINGSGSKMWLFDCVGYNLTIPAAKSLVVNSGSNAYYNSNSILPNGITGDALLI